MKISAKKLARTAIFGAVYWIITFISAPAAFGPIQLRISEAMMVLPYFFPWTSPGLILGCALSNMSSVYGIYDVLFGTLATAITVILISYCGKKRSKTSVAVAVLIPGIVNGLIIGLMTALITMPADELVGAFFLFAAEVFASETAVMLIIGLPALLALPKSKLYVFMSEKKN